MNKMAFSISRLQPQMFSLNSHFEKQSFLVLPTSISILSPSITSLPLLHTCQAARSATGPLNKSSSSSSSASSSKKKKKKRTKNNGGAGANNNLRDVEIVKGEVDSADEDFDSNSNSYRPTMPLPKPPAGFLVDESGRVVMVSNKRIATIVSHLCIFELRLKTV